MLSMSSSVRSSAVCKENRQQIWQAGEIRLASHELSKVLNLLLVIIKYLVP